MGYYIYKYVKNNIIEYIGKTTQLDERIKQHTKDKLKNFNGQIYYFECKNKTAMTSWEYSLINKYHPKYNAALKDKDININIEEPEWKLYMDTDNKIINLLDYLEKPQYANNTTVKKQDVLPVTSVTSTTKIISGPPIKRFTCKHCHAVFETTDWYKTKTMYGAQCPCCHYATHTK